MKIAVMGYSGSGKSTLAAKLAQYHSFPLLHLDKVHWLAGWKPRDLESQRDILQKFMEENSSWVIDGNYTKNHYDKRLEEADLVILMLFGRAACLAGAAKRRSKYNNRSRPDIAHGCEEKLDGEFIRWILFGSRNKKQRERYAEIVKKYPEKTVVIKNRRRQRAFEGSYFCNGQDQRDADPGL